VASTTLYHNNLQQHNPLPSSDPVIGMDRANSGAASEGIGALLDSSRPLVIGEIGRRCTPREPQTIYVIRWMEAFVERAEHDAARRAAEDAYAEAVPDLEPQGVEGSQRRGSPGWRRSTTTTTARWTTCVPRCTMTWSTSAASPWPKTSASC